MLPYFLCFSILEFQVTDTVKKYICVSILTTTSFCIYIFRLRATHIYPHPRMYIMMFNNTLLLIASVSVGPLKIGTRMRLCVQRFVGGNVCSGEEEEARLERRVFRIWFSSDSLKQKLQEFRQIKSIFQISIFLFHWYIAIFTSVSQTSSYNMFLVRLESNSISGSYWLVYGFKFS